MVNRGENFQGIKGGYRSEYSSEKRYEPRKEIVDFVEKYKSQLGNRVLDLGSGDGRNLVYLARQGFQVTGIELSDEGVRKAKQTLSSQGLNGEVVIGDVESLPFGSKDKPEIFDSAICRRVFDYGDYNSTLNKLHEISRILKPGSLFYLSVRSVRQAPKSSEQLIEDYLEGKIYKVVSGSEAGALQHYFSLNELVELAKETKFDVAEIQEVDKGERQKDNIRRFEWQLVLRKK